MMLWLYTKTGKNGGLSVHIDSSLAAKEMYLRRGYREEKTCRIRADNGDILVYDEMEKRIARQHGRAEWRLRQESNKKMAEFDKGQGIP